MGEALRRLSNTAGSEFSLSSIRYSSTLWWISTEAAETRPTTWQAAWAGRRRGEHQIDRWHFTSAGGSTESRVSPKSSWGGTSFRPQGPPRKPPPLFKRNKWAERGEGFRERLSRWEFWLLLFLLQGKKSHVFFLSLSPTGTNCIPLFMSISLSFSLSASLLFALNYGSVCYTISLLG